MEYSPMDLCVLLYYKYPYSFFFIVTIMLLPLLPASQVIQYIILLLLPDYFTFNINIKTQISSLAVYYN